MSPGPRHLPPAHQFW